MRPKTDPKTMTTRAMLALADMNAACRTLDLIHIARIIEKGAGDTFPQLGEALEEWIKSHRPAEAKGKKSGDAPEHTILLGD